MKVAPWCLTSCWRIIAEMLIPQFDAWRQTVTKYIHWLIDIDYIDVMVHWTDKERSTVRAVWEKLDIDQIGPEALAR